MYAVVRHDQASDIPDDQDVAFYDDLTDARQLAAELTRAWTDFTGMRETYRVYEMCPVNDEGGAA